MQPPTYLGTQVATSRVQTSPFIKSLARQTPLVNIGCNNFLEKKPVVAWIAAAKKWMGVC